MRSLRFRLIVAAAAACGPLLVAQSASRFAGEWPKGSTAEFNMNTAKLAEARDHALKGGGSGAVIHRGKLVYSWGDPKARYDLKSTTKSIGATVLGLALADAKLKLHDTAAKHCPDVMAPVQPAQSSWMKRITFLQLATQVAGFEKPGGFQPLLFEPGTKWSYSDSGPNYLADCLTVIYGRDLQDLMFDRIFTPLGITPDDLRWRENQYRPKTLNGIARREFGSGIHANVEAMARIGFMYNRAGRIGSRQVLPSAFVSMLRQPVRGVQGLPVLRFEEYPNASDHYGLLWWNNADGGVAGVPKDAFWSWGLYDSHIVVIPSLDLVVARAGKAAPDGSSGAAMSRLEPFLRPLADSVDVVSAHINPPYPPSPIVASVEWAPVETIHRTGSDCDNFPATWADDDALYTAHGDCRGFEPLRPHKLGLGFARVTGEPLSARGVNIPAPSADNTGAGAQGKKASGMLMVDGILYMWARNAGNSQLAWSTDHARSWTWSDWRFTESFGHPTFLNFGKNYAGARDAYVYVYSPDNHSAYVGTGHMVLARVPKRRIRDRAAYEFFTSLDARGQPQWSRDVARRRPVFSNPPRGVYRTQVSYNGALKRYFMNQILIGSDYVRFQGGFGVYDAPEPWGPWTTAFFTPMWDVGPGENNHFPPKWMSADGRTMHLIFSGDDVFSVRKATVHLRQGRRRR
jgi:CubicO group peptidase (beta-lactamase class C family)